jgi:bifunctional DNase/RNase
MRAMLEALGAEVARVDVSRIDDGTFYGEITLSSSAGARVVDARPSDAVALASRVGAPIWVADDVMAEAGMLDSFTAEEAAADADERLDEFKKFIDEIEPEDFA